MGERKDKKSGIIRDRIFDESIELKDNAMLKKKPELFYEWDFEKNNGLELDVYKITQGSRKKAWWICPECKSSYDMIINRRVGNNPSNCPYCRGLRVNETNSLATLFPDLASQWHPVKNDGLTPHDVTVGSSKKVWWTCPDCSSDYDASIIKRTKRRNCPYCSGKRVNHTNSLKSMFPDISNQWNYSRNGQLKPDNIVSGSSKKVWWLGDCGHEWDAVVRNRTVDKTGCPYCSGHKVLRGFNDMWTTNPEMASMLANPEVGYKYMQNSIKQVDWKCLECGNVMKNKRIDRINRQGLTCPRCSDNTKTPEKFMYNLLKISNIDFRYDESREWSQGRRYDFYSEKYNTIIETHGEQHYVNSGYKRKNRRGRTLEEEQENDRFKEQLARENGIDKYIVIDCRHSTLKWIKNSIENSELKDIIDLDSIDWIEIGRLASKSMVKEVCDLWNSGICNVIEIATHTKLSSSTVRKYLKRGTEIGWCNYCQKHHPKAHP